MTEQSYNSSTLGKIRRYFKKYEDEEEFICDAVWIDRTTGREVPYEVGFELDPTIRHKISPKIDFWSQLNVIASGDQFIADSPTQSQRLLDLGADIVDMEAGAIVQTAETLGAKWLVIKATTDGANQDSDADFQTNLHKAARQAARTAWELIPLLR